MKNSEKAISFLCLNVLPRQFTVRKLLMWNELQLSSIPSGTTFHNCSLTTPQCIFWHLLYKETRLDSLHEASFWRQPCVEEGLVASWQESPWNERSVAWTNEMSMLTLVPRLHVHLSASDSLMQQTDREEKKPNAVKGNMLPRRFFAKPQIFCCFACFRGSIHQIANGMELLTSPIKDWHGPLFEENSCEWQSESQTLARGSHL